MDNRLAPMGWGVKLWNDNLLDTFWKADLRSSAVRCYASADNSGERLALFLVNRLDSAQDTAVFLGKVGVGISRENLRPRKIRHRDQHIYNREIEKDRIRLDAVLNFVILNYLMPYFLLNLSTRPLVSTSFCLPV